MQREKMGILGQLLWKIFFLVGFFSDRRVDLDTLGCVRSFVLLFRIFFLNFEKFFLWRWIFFGIFFYFCETFFCVFFWKIFRENIFFGRRFFGSEGRFGHRRVCAVVSARFQEKKVDDRKYF